MKNGTSFGIKTKLLLLVGFGVATFIGLAYYASQTVGGLSQTISFLGNQRIPITAKLGDIRAGSNGVPRFLWLALAQPAGSAERKKSLDKVEEFWAMITDSIAELEKYELVDQAKDELQNMKSLVAPLDDIVHTGAKALAVGSSVKDAEARQILMSRMPSVAVQLTQHSLNLSKIISDRNKVVVSEAEAAATAGTRLLFTVAIALGLVSAIGGYMFATYLSKSLSMFSQKIAESTKQVASAALQVSAVSQQLASTSAEQASSVEETSASLEEITGMVENNVRNAENGLRVVEEVKTSSGRGNEVMESLLNAMTEIMASNKRIEKLVKVIDEIGEKTAIIDEIVFQTKLLSFNASVEAERAGEHGRGFAVVAQEVGNLAQMSGKAALEISGIVKSSIKEAQEISSENKSKVEIGGQQVKEAAAILKEIQKGADSVLSGSRQILSASKEQFVGFKQISTAMENINQATQETSSSSGEAASAGEELSAHSQYLDKLVNDMNTLVTGKNGAPIEEAPHAVKQFESHNPTQRGRQVGAQRAKNPVTKFTKTEKTSTSGTSFEPQSHIKLVANGSHEFGAETPNSSNSSGSTNWDRL